MICLWIKRFVRKHFKLHFNISIMSNSVFNVNNFKAKHLHISIIKLHIFFHHFFFTFSSINEMPQIQ